MCVGEAEKRLYGKKEGWRERASVRGFGIQDLFLLGQQGANGNLSPRSSETVYVP